MRDGDGDGVVCEQMPVQGRTTLLSSGDPGWITNYIRGIDVLRDLCVRGSAAGN